MHVLLVTLHFLFEFETVNKPGFEPEPPGLKAAMLTFVLHSIYYVAEIYEFVLILAIKI